MASYRGDYQLHWRLVLAGEGLSHAVAVRWSEMENAKRPDAVADELQQRANAWSQPGGFVFGQHVPLSIYAPSAACSVERDQGAQEEGLGVRIRDLSDGTRTGNPFADSREAGGEAQGVGWKLLARGGRVRGKRPYVYVAGGREIDDCAPDMDGALETVQSNSKSLLFKGFREISFTPLPVENPRMPAHGGGRQHLIFVREKFEYRTRIVLVA